MKLGIMQPYFLPYIGYWQLMNAVDTYVIYDDVNYIKGGWVNRNRLLLNGKPFLFTVPLVGMSPFKKINEIGISFSPEKMLKTIGYAYAKAPYYDAVIPWVEELLRYRTDRLSDYLIHSIRMIAEKIGIQTNFLISSELTKDGVLNGQDKVIDICTRVKASEYINAINGQKLYSGEAFSKKGIHLFFIRTDDITYKQFGDVFVPNLSILDVVMFNSPQEVKTLLSHCSFIRAGGEA